jgi:hypothetical protein
MAFQQDTRKVVTIPVGAVVQLTGIRTGLRIQPASWDGRSVLVYEQDLAANSLKLVPQRLSPHPT